MSEPAPTPTPSPEPTPAPSPAPTPAPEPTPSPAPTSAGFASFLDETGTKFKEGWTAGLPDHLKPHEKTLAKFPTPIDALASYANLEKKLSERTPKPPGADATDEQRAEWRKIVGAPVTPEEYGLKPAEGQEANWNADLAKAASEIAFKHGLPPAALAELAETYNATMRSAVEKAEAEAAGEAERVQAALSQEWGKDAAQNAARVQRAAKALGLDIENPRYGNDPDIAKALLRFDKMTNEDAGLIGSSEVKGYQDRMAQIQTELRTVPIGSPKQVELVAEMERLWNAANKR